jgi:hypothetical protein
MSAFALANSCSAVLFSFLGLGLPVGIPPDSEDAIMAHVAPDDCVFYSSWSAAAKPSLSSPNQTEQLLAEPEVQAFATALYNSLLSAGVAAAKKNGLAPEEADKLSKFATLSLGTLFHRSGAIYISRLTPSDQGFDVQGAAIIKANEASADLERSFTDLLKVSRLEVSETTLAGRKFNKITISGNTPLGIVWSSGNGFFLLGVGPAAMEEMSERIRAKKEPAWLAQLKSNLPVDRRASITFLNIRRLMDTFLPLGGPQADKACAALGLKQVTSLQAVSGLDKTRMITRSLVTIEGQPKGLLTLLDDKGLTASHIGHVPSDSLSAMAFCLDLRKVVDLVTASLADIDPQAGEQAKQSLAMGQALFGVSVSEALSALGTHWTMHSPADGGGVSAVIVAEVRDKSKLATIEKTLLSRLVNQAGEIANVGRITRSSIAGQSVATVTPSAPVPVAPSWCLTDKRLILAANPQGIKAILSRQPTDKSLAEVPDIASPLLAASLVGANGPLALSYHDTPRSVAGMHAQASVLLPTLNSAAEKAGIPFNLDPGKLPPQRAVIPHLKPSISIVRRTEKGLEFESRKTYPALSANPAAAGIAVALLLPAVQASRDAAKQTAANQNATNQSATNQSATNQSSANQSTSIPNSANQNTAKQKTGKQKSGKQGAAKANANK